MKDAYDAGLGSEAGRADLDESPEEEAAEGVLPTSDKGLQMSVKPCILAACRDVTIRTSVLQWSRQANDSGHFATPKMELGARHAVRSREGMEGYLVITGSKICTILYTTCTDAERFGTSASHDVTLLMDLLLSITASLALLHRHDLLVNELLIKIDDCRALF
jgi:hypothetical protein